MVRSFLPDRKASTRRETAGVSRAIGPAEGTRAATFTFPLLPFVLLFLFLLFMRTEYNTPLILSSEK